MTDIENLLGYIQKTNPEITIDKLIYELSKSRYSAMSLIMTWQNSGKVESLSSN